MYFFGGGWGVVVYIYLCKLLSTVSCDEWMYMCVISVDFFQFLCEMAVVWQFFVDSRIGIFEEDKKRFDFLVKVENEVFGLDLFFVKFYYIWIQVYIKRV